MEAPPFSPLLFLEIAITVLGLYHPTRDVDECVAKVTQTARNMAETESITHNGQFLSIPD